MVNPRQGEIWWAELEEKRRPVLVVTRPTGTQQLKRIVVAPVTRTVRGIPTEIALDERHGVPKPCVASFDNLQVVLKGLLTDRIGSLQRPVQEICRALSALADC